MKQYLCLLAAIATLLPVVAQATPTTTPSGYITLLYGGWVNANLRVETDFAFTNPENCSATDGYITSPTDGGNALFSSMLLSAYMSHRKVRLVIDGCTLDRPHIIGVVVEPN